jgi:hypothetical protein
MTVLRPVLLTQRSHMNYDCPETCCVDSAQSFDIMTVLRPVVWTQCSHYDKIFSPLNFPVILTCKIVIVNRKSRDWWLSPVIQATGRQEHGMV